MKDHSGPPEVKTETLRPNPKRNETDNKQQERWKTDKELALGYKRFNLK